MRELSGISSTEATLLITRYMGRVFWQVATDGENQNSRYTSNRDLAKSLLGLLTDALTISFDEYIIFVALLWLFIRIYMHSACVSRVHASLFDFIARNERCMKLNSTVDRLNHLILAIVRLISIPKYRTVKRNQWTNAANIRRKRENAKLFCPIFGKIDNRFSARE